MIELQIINDCPNSAPAQELFARALKLEGLNPDSLAVRVIENDDDAAAAGFHGSPSFTLDGRDLFPSTADPAVSCRVYPTETGLAGLPELEVLRRAIRAA